MKKFCEFSREYAMKTSSFGKKKMKLLTEEQKESYENSKICYIYKEELEDKNIVKFEIIVIIQESIEVLCIVYVI